MRKSRLVNRRFAFYLLIPLFFNISVIAGADTVYLKNGRSIEGFVKSESDNVIELDIGIGTIKFGPQEIERIDKSGPVKSAQIRSRWEREKLESEQRLAQKKRLEELKPREAELNQEQGQIVIDALLNKNVPAKLFLDTGSSLVVLRSDIAKKAGVDTGSDKSTIKLYLADGRKIYAGYARLKYISVQGVEVENVEAAILPDDAIDSNAKDGLLGMSFLGKCNFKIDSKNKKLIIEKNQ